MTPRIKFSVVFSSMLLTLMLVLGAVLGRGEDKDGAYQPLAVYTEVLARIKSDYVEEPDIEKVTRGALQGLVENLDPLSSYLTAEQYQEYKKRLKAPDGGTGLSSGLVVHKRGAYTAVLSVLPGSAADQAGIRPGDLIEALDGLATRMMPPAYLNAKLSGKPGEPLRLLIRSARDYNEPQEYTLKRAKVELPDVEHKMLENSVGYIDVGVLDSERVSQVGEAIRELEKAGAKKLILDLRGVVVGDPKEGFRLAGYFVSGAKLGSVKGQRFAEQSFDASPDSALTDLPLAVLVDRPSSGAAELAAAAILDNRRGELVGERTYGLAAVQDTIELDDGTALILSVAKYYRPNGEVVHGAGVEPSKPIDPAELRRFRRLESESGASPAPAVEDPFMKKALEALEAADSESKAA